MSAEGTPVASRRSARRDRRRASPCRNRAASAFWSPSGRRPCWRLVAAAVATPGFLTATSLFSLATTMSFIGCVAVGMTFITLSGNVMSFCLGATLSVTTIVFMASLPIGLAGALVVAFLFSAVLTGLQGW